MPAAIYLLGIGIGLLFIAVAVFNWDAWFVDHESRFVEILGGESLVRWYWGSSGLAVIGYSLLAWAKVV